MIMISGAVHHHFRSDPRVVVQWAEEAALAHCFFQLEPAVWAIEYLGIVILFFSVRSTHAFNQFSHEAVMAGQAKVVSRQASCCVVGALPSQFTPFPRTLPVDLASLAHLSGCDVYPSRPFMPF